MPENSWLLRVRSSDLVPTTLIMRLRIDKMWSRRNAHLPPFCDCALRLYGSPAFIFARWRWNRMHAWIASANGKKCDFHSAFFPRRQCTVADTQVGHIVTSLWLLFAWREYLCHTLHRRSHPQTGHGAPFPHRRKCGVLEDSLFGVGVGGKSIDIVCEGALGWNLEASMNSESHLSPHCVYGL
jgi:hypothetical protein